MMAPEPTGEARGQSRWTDRPRWLNWILLPLVVAGGFVTVILMLLILGFLFNPISLLAIGGATAFWVGLRDQRFAMTMDALPTARASSAAIGLVELEGVARADGTSLSPVSGQRCLRWDVKLEVREKRGDETEWHVISQLSAEPAPLILLEDATGRVPVWTRGADWILANHQWESHKTGAPPPASAAWLEQMGCAWASGRHLRLSESLLLEGGPLYAIGTLDEQRMALERCRSLGQHGDPAHWTRRQITVEPLLRLLPVKLAQFIQIMGGMFGMGEFLGDHKAVRTEEAQPPELPPERVLLWHGSPGRPFILSDRHETAALDRVRVRARWLILGGSASMVGALIWLLTEMA